ncbi:hypothetical protein [Fontivita pretiosa]|uniref:hypothetical protein n=1 Tax=Fontivita pretiosa TaxID=2989684 RepID=UPI003D17E2F2
MHCYLIERLESRRLLAGVTLIAHGFNSGIGDWVSAMASAISGSRTTPASIFALQATDDGNNGPISVSLGSQLSGPSVSASTNPDPHIILLLDWSDLAGTLPFGGYHRSTTDVAAAVAAQLLDPAFMSSLGGYALAASPAMQLVGHSRGGSLVNELARDLARKGVWVDQLTTLDPHPVDGVNEDISGFDFDDAPMGIPWNVAFADNYWRTDSDIFDFNGEAVSGAHNLQFNETILRSSGSYSFEHSDVHLWYHGTIPPYADSDGAASVNPATWYSPPHPPRNSSGFYYTRNEGGIRPGTGLWPADGGVAPRGDVPRDPTGTQWPNIDHLALLGAPSGGTVSIAYRYQDFDSPATITWLADVDRNPFNSNAHLLPDPLALPSTGATLASGSDSVQLAGLSPGQWNLLARIADAQGHARYAYVPDPLTVPATPLIASNGDLLFETAPQRISVRFSADVSASLDPGDLTVRPVGGAAGITPASVQFDPASNTATFWLADILADGNYRATIPAGSVMGAAGETMTSDFSFDFFFLAGDANRDRAVDRLDLDILTMNWQQSPRVFSQGDFSYDSRVDTRDLYLLATRWGQSLQAPVPARGDSSLLRLFARRDQNAKLVGLIERPGPVTHAARQIVVVGDPGTDLPGVILTKITGIEETGVTVDQGHVIGWVTAQ